MTRGLLIIAFSGISFIAINAQQDPAYSLYMNNQMSINPAYAGINDLVCLGLDIRNQWTGIEGAPATGSFSGNAPFKPFGAPSGIGLSIVTDKLGFENNFAMNLAYSYKITIRNGKLGIGMGLGFRNMSFIAATKWLAPSTDVDAEIIKAKESAFGFDMGLGSYYKTDNLFMGFSVNHLVATMLKFEQAEYKPSMSYNLLAGYNMQLNNPEFEIQPSAFISSDGKTTQATLNATLAYNK